VVSFGIPEAIRESHETFRKLIFSVSPDDDLDIPSLGRWYYINLGQHSLRTNTTKWLQKYREKHCNLGTTAQICDHGTSMAPAALTKLTGGKKGC
jgi:hypothetical protein